MLAEYLGLWDLLSEIVLKPGVEDTHLWLLSSLGQYLAKSTYKDFLQGSIQFRPWERVWKSWAPGKCRFFIWMVMHKQCCTADRLVRRGLPHLELRLHCDREEETIDHLLTGVYLQDSLFWPPSVITFSWRCVL